MKFTINVDCTPEEARTFFGLPDLGPMQDAILADMQERMQKNLAAMDPESLMQLWMPQMGMANAGQGQTAGMQAFTDLQKMIWDQMTNQMGDMMSGDQTKKRKK